MIDEKVFRDSWVLLCERFGRQHSGPLMMAYYGCISPKMTTEQFKAAARKAFEDREYFPRPADFLETVKPDRTADALQQWELVQLLMQGYGTPESLSLEARRVVRLLGGETKLRNTPLDSVQWVRRDFLKLYGDACEVAEREAGHRIEATPEGNRLTAEIMAEGQRRAG